MNLGENIYRLRTGRNLSQADLADKLEVSRQSISKWETGTAVPELDKLVKMSALFGVSLDELVGDSAPAQSPTPQTTPKLPADPPSGNTGTAVGIVLFICALLTFLLTGLEGFILLGIPMAVCGILCLVLKRSRGVWCGWVLLFWIPLWLPNPTATFTPFWTLLSSLARPSTFSASLYQLIITLVANAITVLVAVSTLRSYLPGVIRYVSIRKTNLLLGWLLTFIPSIISCALDVVIIYQLAQGGITPRILSISIYLLTWLHLGAVLTMLIFTIARLRVTSKA